MATYDIGLVADGSISSWDTGLKSAIEGLGDGDTWNVTYYNASSATPATVAAAEDILVFGEISSPNSWAVLDIPILHTDHSTPNASAERLINTTGIAASATSSQANEYEFVGGHDIVTALGHSTGDEIEVTNRQIDFWDSAHTSSLDRLAGPWYNRTGPMGVWAVDEGVSVYNSTTTTNRRAGLSLNRAVGSAPHTITSDGEDLLREMLRWLAEGAVSVPDQVGVVATTIGDGEVDLTWTAPDDGNDPITDYVVEYRPSGGSWSTFADGTSTATSTTVTGLTNGQPYGFRVSAVNGIGTGDASDEVEATPATLPGAPTGLALSADYEQLDASWSAPASNGGSAITDYEYRTRIGAGAWSAEVSDGADLAAEIAGLTGGTTYGVQVRAVNGVGASAWSTEATATPYSPVVPDPPTGLSATGGAGEVDLTWSAPAFTGGAPITDYEVDYRIAAGSWSTFADGTSTATSTTVTGLTDGVDYEFRVRAVNKVGASADSDTVLARPASAPDAPTGLTATAGYGGVVYLEWVQPASDGGRAIYDYVVEVDDGGGWATFADGASTATEATVTGLTDGVSHDFRVSALNPVDASSPSNVASATPVAPTVPDTPTGLLARPGNKAATLTWFAPADNGAAITRYRIQTRLVGDAWGSMPDTDVTEVGGVVEGLNNYASYEFRVAAENSEGFGAFTAAVTATPRPAYGPVDPRPAGRLGRGDVQVWVLHQGGMPEPLTLPSIPGSGYFTRELSSVAEIVVPVTIGGAGDQRVLDELRRLRKWEHEIAVEWDGKVEALGPVIDIDWGQQSVTITCGDVAAWLERTDIPTGSTYTDADLSTIAETEVQAALDADDSNRAGIVLDFEPAGRNGDRDYSDPASIRYAADQLSELADEGVEWWAYRRTIRAADPYVDPAVAIRLSDADFATPPPVNEVGSLEANEVVVIATGGDVPIIARAQDTADIAARGRLVRTFTDSAISTQGEADALAAKLLGELRRVLEIDAGANIELRPSAAVRMAELLPGAIVRVDLQTPARPVTGLFVLTAVRATFAGAVAIQLQAIPAAAAIVQAEQEQTGAATPPEPDDATDVTFVGAATAGSNGAGTITIDPIDDLEDGDVVVVALTQDDSEGSPATWSSLDGFDVAGSLATSDGKNMTTAYATKVISSAAGESAWRFQTGNTSQGKVAVAAVFRGVDNASPVFGTAGPSSGTNDATPTGLSVASPAGGVAVSIVHLAYPLARSTSGVAPDGWALAGWRLQSDDNSSAFAALAYQLTPTATTPSIGAWRNSPDDAVSEWHRRAIALEKA